MTAARLFAVIPEYSYGPEMREIQIVDSEQAAVAEANSRQQAADEFGIPVVLRVYELTELTKETR